MTPADRAALAQLTNAARHVALDRPDRVQSFVLGLLAAGVDHPETLGRCLRGAGIAEALWRQALEPIAETTRHGGGTA